MMALWMLAPTGPIFMFVEELFCNISPTAGCHWQATYRKCTTEYVDSNRKSQRKEIEVVTFGEQFQYK